MFSQDEIIEMRNAEDMVHQAVEELIDKYMPYEMMVIAKAAILCPTCQERKVCELGKERKRAYRETWEEVFSRRKENVVVGDSGGIVVPNGMSDMERES
jgi:hypothetical protein